MLGQSAQICRRLRSSGASSRIWMSTTTRRSNCCATWSGFAAWRARRAASIEPGTLIARLQPELGQGGVTEVEVQPLGPTSQNLIEVLQGTGDRCFVIDAHTDTVPEGQPGPLV